MRVPRRVAVGFAIVSVLAACCEAQGAAAPAQPNILLLYPDQWRWDWAGFHPERADLRTPNIAEIASQGTRFTNAYSPSPWCSPARSCMASGQFFDESPKTLNGQDFPIGTPTWYSEMQRLGYHTIVVGKDDLTQSVAGTYVNGSRHAKQLGFDDWFRMQDKYVTFMRQQPWDQYGAGLTGQACGVTDSGKPNLFGCNKWCYGMFGYGSCCHRIESEGYNCNRSRDQVGAMQENYIDDYVTAQASMLLDKVPIGKPWVLHVSFPGPHPPFIITEAMNQSIAGRDFPASQDNQRLTKAEQLQIRQQYAAEIENLDRLIGSLKAKVALRGEGENTLIVVTSDHGEQLGDQNSFGKRKPWEPSVRVPLIVAGPGVAARRSVETPVSVLDLVGTFLDRAGSGAEELGLGTRSLQPLLQVEAPDEESYLQRRPFVSSGLTYPGDKRNDPVDFRLIVKRVNSTHTLKVICCPTGCAKGNTYIPTTRPEPQLLAFNVVAGDPGAYDTVNLGHLPEARQLAALLPGRYATACLPSGAQSEILVRDRSTTVEVQPPARIDTGSTALLSKSAQQVGDGTQWLTGGLVVAAAAGLALALLAGFVASKSSQGYQICGGSDSDIEEETSSGASEE